MQALPNEAETIKAIQKLDLLVVVDVIPSEMAGWADVVLPESIYLERYDDLNVELFREPFVALRQPVVAAPHDQKPNWWIARELAKKLGLERVLPVEDIEEYLEHRLTKAGLSFAELKQKGIIRGAPQPIYFDDGVAAGVSDAVGEDRVLLDAAARQGVRSGPEVHEAGGAAVRARSGCSSAGRPCTRSAARSRTRSSTR